MTIPHAYPGTFSALYDRLQAEAVARGVCPKITACSPLASMHACGKPLAEGKRWCVRHPEGR